MQKRYQASDDFSNNVKTALFQDKEANKNASPMVVNLLVSMPYESKIAALLKKIESDCRRKSQQVIKCQQILVQDCFEIVDLAKSQIQAYLTDQMHVTVLAIISEELKPAVKQIVETKAVNKINNEKAANSSEKE